MLLSRRFVPALVSFSFLWLLCAHAGWEAESLSFLCLGLPGFMGGGVVLTLALTRGRMLAEPLGPAGV